ncbi:MAG: DMT family transporter [Chitinophagales bacterium]
MTSEQPALRSAAPLAAPLHPPTGRPAGKLGGILCVLGAVAIWGPTYVATKIVLSEMRPFLLVFVRFLLSTVFLAPLAWTTWRRLPAKPRLPLGKLAAMGLTGAALYYALQNAGQTYVTAVEASLFSALLPAITAVVAWLLVRERLGLWGLGGVALAVAGVVFMTIGSSSGQGGLSLSLTGYLLLLGGDVSWAVFTIIGQEVNASLPAAIVAFFNIAWGTLFVLPLTLYDLAGAGWPHVSLLSWAMIAFLGLGGSGLTFILWNHGLKTLSPGEATTLTNLVPFLGAASGSLVLKEPLTWAHLWGALLVVGGVLLVTRPSQRPQA